MPGGAALVGIKATQHPAEVARVMDYLASEEIAGELYARSLFVPGHLGLAKKGVEYKSASPLAAAALKVFASSVAQISPAAYRLQGYASSRIIFNATISRLGQVVAGETSLEEAYQRIASDVAQQIAERNKK
jgi:alpha-1,4-digalacturonate transport system substrate-binding protein